MQKVNNLLRAPQAESGDNHLTLLRFGPLHDAQQPLFEFFGGRVDGASVGRFGDQHIATTDRLRVAQQRQATTSKIAGVDDAVDVSAVLDIHFGDGRAQNVTGFGKSQTKRG